MRGSHDQGWTDHGKTWRNRKIPGIMKLITLMTNCLDVKVIRRKKGVASKRNSCYICSGPMAKKIP